MTTESNKNFRCRDVGYDCEWHIEGSSEEEMLPKIEAHAADVHNLSHFKEEALANVRKAIHDRA